MTDDHRQCKGALGIAILIGAVFGIPLTGGLIIPAALVVWGLVALRRRNQRAYDAQKRRQAVEDDAAYGRRMRGY